MYIHRVFLVWKTKSQRNIRIWLHLSKWCSSHCKIHNTHFTHMSLRPISSDCIKSFPRLQSVCVTARRHVVTSSRRQVVMSSWCREAWRGRGWRCPNTCPVPSLQPRADNCRYRENNKRTKTRNTSLIIFESLASAWKST